MLLVDVFRSAHDCTNGGITSKHNSFWLLDVDESEPAQSKIPCLRVCYRPQFGFHVEPLIMPQGMIGPMFGGNFVWTSDSRFTEKYGKGPLKVHDRFETARDFEVLSR